MTKKTIRKSYDTHRAMVELQKKVASQKKMLEERDVQTARLHQTIFEISKTYQASTSWRITKPIRMLRDIIKYIKKMGVFSKALFLNLKHFRKVGRTLKNKDLGTIKNHLQWLQSKKDIDQFAIERGLSPDFLRLLIALANLFFKIRTRWFSNRLCREYTTALLDFFTGKTGVLNKKSFSHIRFNIDTPKRIFNIFYGDSLPVSGWGINLRKKTASKIRIRIGERVCEYRFTQREDVRRAFISIDNLPLDLGFCASLALSMGLHRICIDIEDPHDNWITVFRAFVLRIPKINCIPYKKPISYRKWIHVEEKRLKVELPNIVQHMDIMIHKPLFTIIVDTRRCADGLNETLSSMHKQIYPHYDLRILEYADLKDILGTFIIFIQSGERLSKYALYEFANVLNQDPEVDLIYADEDSINASNERCKPFYKPSWSPDYLETFNYIGFPACFRTSLAKDCIQLGCLYDFMLRFTEKTNKIFHVSKILGHKPEQATDENYLNRMSIDNIKALQGRLERTGRCGAVQEHMVYRGCYDIQLVLKQEPLVSIIIPTAGKKITIEGREIDLIINLVHQIRNQSTYKNIEIIVVDNGDLSGEQRGFLARHHCKNITYTDPVFNISKKLNLGASMAQGTFLLLMNDDIEILNPSWIERMLEHFEKKHVGVVGAKLLYPSGAIQHAGVVHNFGNPDHARRLFSGNEAGYYFSTCGVRNFMAVTGAVMMTPSNLYLSVGGYSEVLSVSYNDVDFCLKVQEKGFYIAYAPKVELTHMESQSRVASLDMSEYVWYQKQWAAQTVSDPYYNEHYLTVASPTFIPCINERML